VLLLCLVAAAGAGVEGEQFEMVTRDS